MRFVYIVRCSDGTLYVGETGDVTRRLDAHNKGCASVHTARRRPVQLVFVEQQANRAASLRREKRLRAGRARRTS
jgi:putative endonuclease